MRVRVVTAALLLAIAPAVSAQSAGTFEIGAFGKNTFFDDKLGLDNKFGGGGSLGFYLLRNLALEAEGGYTKSRDAFNNSVSNIPLRARLTYNVPLGGFGSALQLGAGYVRDLYRQDVHFNDNGFTALAGFRYGLTEHWALRVDGTLDYVPSPEANRADKYTNLGIQAGLSLLFGNSYDSDHDGVKNDVDRCPNTPRGEQVDASGCSDSQRDSDTDGVKDNVDKCPNTPAGEKVDADGCADSQKDADGDGVLNTVDKCPNTPSGEQVDADGCAASQRDADGDGVMDNADKCPNTPAGEKVDANGCSQSQLDADGDGVPDASDQCANTPKGTPVDANGCPQDTDGDGVADGVDQCPNTPQGQAVDEKGCPILFQQGAKQVVLKGVNFETNKSDLTEDSKGVLQDVAKSLQENPDVKVEVAGHTDNVGTAAYNLRLSRARAKAVRDFLVANGVPASQLTSKGYGESKPIAPNKTADGRAQNRRVELNRLN
ncbi:MAG TPA: OmpA family protein [Gemmatimonadales bacterium]|nr:OmpA family protein [Gemmatimonadales bacterium]